MNHPMTDNVAIAWLSFFISIGYLVNGINGSICSIAILSGSIIIYDLYDLHCYRNYKKNKKEKEDKSGIGFGAYVRRTVPNHEAEVSQRKSAHTGE